MAKKKPADTDVLVAEAEAVEHELQTVIEAAAVSGWQPIHVQRCQELAAVSARIRGELGGQVPGHVARFVV